MHNKALISCKFAFALALGVIVSAVLYLGLLHGASARSAHAQAVDTPTPVPTAEPTANPGSQNLQPTQGKVNPPKYPNMDSNLNHIIQQVESGQNTIQVAAARAPLHTEGSVAVTIYITEGYVDTLLEFLKVEGTFPRNVGIDYIEAYVPVSLLPETSVQEGVISIRTIVPPQPVQEAVVSQGASVHGATAWHDAGYKGQNVKVGIIDVDFEDYSSHIGTEVPEPVEVRCYLENTSGSVSNLNTHTTNLSDCENGDAHGTAVTEALFDIAPEATYYIANPLTWGDLVDAVDWIVEHDVDVINMSVTWPWSGPGDGESLYSSSPLKTVDSAVDGGIVWLNAAGNKAMATWYGPFADVDADGWHNFSDEDECNNLSLEIEAGEKFSAQLRWDDSWITPATDLDLYLSLVEQSGLTDVALSENDQTETLEPFEFVSFTALVSGIYCLSTKLYSGDAPDWIQLQSFTGQDFEYHTLHHSIGEPADSANAGLLAVGAAHVSDTSTIEDFSSRGPTADDRIKPDLVGADNVHSAAYGEEFSGTSQASPHVAGLAALVKQRFPDHTPQQIASYLKNHTEERGEPGADNIWGHGFARLLASDAATPVPTVTPDPTPTPSPTPEPAITIAFGEPSWSSVKLQNRVAQYLAELGYGYSTSVESGSYQPLFEALRAGNIDVLMEVWSPSQEENLEEALAEGSVSSPGSSLGSDWQSTFVIPKYLQEQYPDLDSVEDLKEEQYRTLFATDETDGKARLLSCPVGWNCAGVNAKQVEGYGLSDHVHIVNPASGEDLNADITEAYENEEPWLGFQWGTNSPALLFDLVRLEEPAYTDECWSTTMACAYEDSTILIAVKAGLSESADDFVDMLTEWDFNVDGNYKPAFRWQAADPNANIEAAAMWWLRGNGDVWSEWVTSDASATIQSALDSGEIPDGWPQEPSITPEPSPDRAVLVALYNATDGDNWTDKENWLSDEPLEEWQGVTTDDEGRVIELHLWENNLQGSIPSELGNLSKLTTLELQSNQLTGEIPSELGNLSNLSALYLWENDLSGEIPSELGNLSSLTVLDLPGNELSGEIPAELGNLSNLTVLILARNQLSGEIPSELGSLSNLVELELYENDLSGEIPNELGNLASLTVLDLGVNQLSGEIPAELGSLSNLTVLSLWENELSGEVPPELGSLSNLEILSLSYNQLSGEIPTELGALSDLEKLYLNSNRLSGEIPSELSGLANLTDLYLWGNELSGWIPSELGSLDNLQDLNLTRNQLSGEIPAELGSLSKMELMSLSRNRLSGEIPSELGRLSNLDQLYLYDNQLSGNVPSELLAISGLRIMALYGNQLSGDVPEHPDERATLTTLYNSTGGTGWNENENWGSAEPVFSWTRVLIDTSGHVTALWLHENELSGEIPSELGSLTNLARLYLYDNQLTGEIPSELSDLENLENLYLAGNQLSGCIPTGLKDVPENDFADTGLPFCDEELPDVSPDCTDYSESPDLAEKVASGELPSVCDRLPSEPLTIQTQDDTGEYGGILRRFYLGPADSCNFFRISRASLVRFSQDGFSLIPSVAKDWEVSEDGKEWTFHLRESMKWSDGDDFTADDFVWQYENVILNEDLTPGLPFFLRIGNEVGSIEKVDDTTVKFVFPEANFLFAEIAAQADEACYGTSRNVPWAPSHYMQQFHIDHNPDVEQDAQDAGFDDWVEYYDYKTQYRLNPDKPTIAPWKFTNPLGDQVVLLERNPYFWGVDPAGNQLPYLDGIQMTLVESTEAGTLMAAQGDIDMQGRHIRLNQYVPLREHRIDGGYTVLTWPTFGGSDVAFFFNMSLPGSTGDAIRTKEFRQALSLAIDRESIKEVMFLGLGELRQNVPPPGHPHYPGDDIAKLRTEYDVEEANRLLDSVFPDRDDEGFRLSNGERIVMKVTVTEAFGPWPDAAQVVGRAWEAVGVKTDVDQTSRSEHFDRWWTNEWAVMVWNDDTTSSTFSRIGTRAPADNAFHGPGCALWIETGGRDGNPDAEGFPCLQESLDLLDMHRRGPGLPEAERNVLGKEIYKTVVENQYSIGIVGLSPMVQGVVVKKNTLHNVPDAVANDWTFRTPNSAFPEQWYFGPEIEPVVALPAALSAGSSHACALDLNGVISCQGVDDSVQVSGLPASGVFTAISVGANHSCAIDIFGRVECWGSDEHGQVSGRPTSGEFIAVGAGARHTCAIDISGSMHCWGSDDHEQSSPPSEGQFVAVGAGDNYTCGLLSDGTLECWGVFDGNSQ